MIDKLRAMAIFATVVDRGTFRAAAKHLGLAPSRISQSVSALEDALGVTLIYRSTRRLSLTSEGHILYGKVADMLQAAESGLDALSDLSKEPAGALRVAAPAFLTQTRLAATIANFARTYPKVALTLHFSDRLQNLIEQGYDVGIRAGWPTDSAHLSRSIGSSDRLLVASPDYLARKANPQHPGDLEDWDWIRFEMRPDRTEFTSRQGKKVTIVGKSRVSVDAADALYEFAARGLGLTKLPENLACRGFERRELVHVLPDWTLAPLGFHAVWPDRSRRASLTLIFVRYLAKQAEFENREATTGRPIPGDGARPVS